MSKNKRSFAIIAGILLFTVISFTFIKLSKKPQPEHVLPIPNALAYPGAEGYGKETRGGRNGKVFYVNSLMDSGPGTLREALESKGPRMVLFEVAGNIQLRDNISITSPYITIAGQSSPGDGVVISGAGIVIQTSEVILRYLRIRPGDNNYKDVNGKIDKSKDTKDWDGITIIPTTEPISNIVIDHCSISWGIDEGIGLNDGGYAISNVTISNSIISEGLDDSHHEKGPHSKGILLNKSTNFSKGKHCYNISFYANLFAHNSQRNVMCSEGNEMEFINNMVYNFVRGTIVKPDAKASIIGNFYKPGVNTRPQVGVSPGHNGIKSRGIQVIQPKESQSALYYLFDNVGIGRIPGATPGENEWDEVWFFDHQAPQDADTITFMADQPPVELSGIIPWSSDQVPENLVDRVGAIYPARDAVDERVLSETMEGMGNIINSQNQVGGYPVLEVAEPRLDSDLDGMPDAWEIQNGYDPDRQDGDQDANGDGYSNLEHYLNQWEIQEVKDFQETP